MKKSALFLLICCLCTACGTKEAPAANATEKTTEVTEAAKIAESTEVKETVEITEAIETTEAAETTETAIAEVSVITPLPTTIDMDALESCTLAVSFEEGDAYVDDNGIMQLDVTVYTYDLYDMVDIATLKEGDIIEILGEEVPVESLERVESGLLFINGGLENGGYDFWHNDSGVFFEHGYNDAKTYYPIGETTLRVSADFEFVDSSDLDKGEVTYYSGDFLTDDAEFMYYFSPLNTSIVVEGGQIIHMTRVYTP